MGIGDCKSLVPQAGGHIYLRAGGNSSEKWSAEPVGLPTCPCTVMKCMISKQRNGNA
jgi:hypothetical protein